jgi:hypothetical protein
MSRRRRCRGPRTGAATPGTAARRPRLPVGGTVLLGLAAQRCRLSPPFSSSPLLLSIAAAARRKPQGGFYIGGSGGWIGENPQGDADQGETDGDEFIGRHPRVSEQKLAVEMWHEGAWRPSAAANAAGGGGHGAGGYGAGAVLATPPVLPRSDVMVGKTEERGKVRDEWLTRGPHMAMKEEQQGRWETGCAG